MTLENDIDDEALAAEMRAYLAFVCGEPDPVDHCVALAEGAAIARMEAEGIALAERRLDQENRR